MSKFLYLNDLSDTKDLALNISQKDLFGSSIGLIGQLGAGKTTFSKFLIFQLGVTEDVTSPSYTLCQEYESSAGTIEHWDLYRLNALPDELYDPPSVDILRIIEWPDKVDGLLEELDFYVKFELVEKEKKLIRKVETNILL